MGKGMNYYLHNSMMDFFNRRAELETRFKKGRFRDSIHKSVFKKTMEEEFTGKEIREALSQGTILETKVVKSGSHHIVYGWNGKQERQVGWFKSSIERLVRWFQS